MFRRIDEALPISAGQFERATFRMFGVSNRDAVACIGSDFDALADVVRASGALAPNVGMVWACRRPVGHGVVSNKFLMNSIDFRGVRAVVHSSSYV